MLRFSLLRLEIPLTPTNFIPDRLIGGGGKRCNREWKRERERKRENRSLTCPNMYINRYNSRVTGFAYYRYAIFYIGDQQFAHEYISNKSIDMTISVNIGIS